MKVRWPRISERSVLSILKANRVDEDYVSVVAIRGYYLDSMGVPGRNDRRIWDDIMVICCPKGTFAYQANTDPNGYRKGHGKGAGKGMAMLKPGIHRYGTGKHKGRVAFRQCERFTVIRDGDPPYEDRGWHAINLHDGGYVSTSSLGCQTVPKQTWSQFRNLMYSLLDEYDNLDMKNDHGVMVPSFDYVLIEETERRKGNLVVSERYF